MKYKFIKFGPEGFPLFYYDELTYPPTDKGQKNADIPADALAVSDQQWLDASMLRLWRAPDGTLTTPPALESGEEVDLVAYAAQKRWEREVGEFVPLDAHAVIAISDAVLAHVSNCFATEAQVLADIEAGAVTTVEQIDAAFAA